eukprot:5695506-Amphidinium_carterae.2
MGVTQNHLWQWMVRLRSRTSCACSEKSGNTANSMRIEMKWLGILTNPAVRPFLGARTDPPCYMRGAASCPRKRQRHRQVDLGSWRECLPHSDSYVKRVLLWHALPRKDQSYQRLFALPLAE